MDVFTFFLHFISSLSAQSVILLSFVILSFKFNKSVITVIAHNFSVLVLTTCSLDTNESQKSNSGKTPIQILHEYGTKSGNLPVYVMERAEGEAHQPSFVFSVTVGDVSGIGRLRCHPCCADRWLSPNEGFYLSWKLHRGNSERVPQAATWSLSLCWISLLLLKQSV